MIDLKLIKAAIAKANLTMSGLLAPAKTEEARHTASAVESMQEVFSMIENPDDPRATNFDCFGWSWNRLSRSDCFRIISRAYKEYPAVFGSLTFDSNIGWQHLNTNQQAHLIKLSESLLSTLVTLFADEDYAQSHRACFIGALREVSNENVQKIRAVA